MIVFLFILLTIFSLLIIFMNQQFLREQKTFDKKMEALQKNIVELNQRLKVQNQKIQLTEEFEKTLQTNKPKLGNMIFNLNHDLFEVLSQNNLLKP